MGIPHAVVRFLYAFLILLTTAAWSESAAQATFHDLEVSPTVASVNVYGNFAVTLKGYARATSANDGVGRIEIRKGTVVLDNWSPYEDGYPEDPGDVIGANLVFNRGISLPAGKHDLTIRAYNAIKGANYSDSPVFTVIGYSGPIPNPTNGAEFVSQTVPTEMIAGASIELS